MDEKQFNLNEKQFLDYFSEQFPNIIVSEDTVHSYFIKSGKRNIGHFYDFILNNGLIEDIIIDDQPEIKDQLQGYQI